jgi:hypothetical protein
MIKDESQYIAIYNKIAPKPTHRQSQLASDIAISQLNDNDYESYNKPHLQIRP